MGRGKFITFEGGEGAGKSTQARMLVDALRAQGRDVVLTREPGGTPGAEAIRSLLLDPPGDGWGARAEALLFAAARADHVARLIEPALARGAWVVCDRFIDSSRAYQGGGGGLDDADLRDLHRIGSAAVMPDLTILIEVPATLVAERLAIRDGGASDAIGGRGADYHGKVGAAFRRLADAEPGRFAILDGAGEPQQIHAAVLAAITALAGAA